MSKPYTYTCDECGETFTAEWSDEEARAEFRQTFGREKTDDDAEVCDDCYKEIMEAHEGEDHAANAAFHDEMKRDIDETIAQLFLRMMMRDPKIQSELRKITEEIDATPPDGSPGTG